MEIEIEIHDIPKLSVFKIDLIVWKLDNQTIRNAFRERLK